MNAKLQNLARMEEVVKIFLEVTNVPAQLVIQERTANKVCITRNKLVTAHRKKNYSTVAQHSLHLPVFALLLQKAR